MNTTRRTILTGLATLPIASMGPAPCGAALVRPDPTLALIDAHRAAFAAFNAALNEECDNAPAEDAAEEAAMIALVETEPTTLAGIHALSAYLTAHVERTGDERPAGWVLPTMTEACRRLLAGGAA